MSETVTLPGTGAVIATDEVTINAVLQQVQRVKLVDGTDGGTGLIGGDATNGLDVDVTRVSGTVQVQSNSANIATETTAAAIETAVELIDDAVFADDAAFTVGTSKVVAAGFLVDETSTDVADEGDVGIARMTPDRKQLIVIGECGSDDVKGGGTKTDTSDQSIMAAGGAGVYNYLQWVTVYNTSSTNTYVSVKDGTTVVAVLPLPAYGGCMFMPPRAIRGTANTAWNLACGAGVTTAHLYGGGWKASN